jgi:hypothetical protein
MDLVRPKKENQITLNDLKKCRSAFLFFDMIFDLKKYDSHVRRIDPMFRALDDMYIDNLDGTKTKLEYIFISSISYFLGDSKNSLLEHT